MSNPSTKSLLFFKNTCSLSQLGVEVDPTIGSHKFKSDDMRDMTTGWGQLLPHLLPVCATPADDAEYSAQYCCRLLWLHTVEETHTCAWWPQEAVATARQTPTPRPLAVTTAPAAVTRKTNGLLLKHRPWPITACLSSTPALKPIVATRRAEEDSWTRSVSSPLSSVWVCKVAYLVFELSIFT